MLVACRLLLYFWYYYPSRLVSMKAIRLFLVITSLVLFKTVDVYAQYNETIRADRPGAAIVPFTVGRHVLQLQAGYAYSELEINKSGYSEAYLNAVDNVIRYGLTENFEINSGLGLAGGRGRTDSTTSQVEGLNIWSIGMRYNIYSGVGWVPSVGFQTTLGLPWLDSDFDSEHVRPSLTLIAALNMGSKLSLTTNLGLVWDGNSANAISYYVVNFSFAATDRLSIFIEPYGYVDAGTWNPYYNIGSGLLITNNLQLDLFGGFGTGPHEFQEWLISTGISWRVQFKKAQDKSN